MVYQCSEPSSRPARVIGDSVVILLVAALLRAGSPCAMAQDAGAVRAIGPVAPPPSAQPPAAPVSQSVKAQPETPAGVVAGQVVVTPDLAAAMARTNGLDVALARVAVWQARANLNATDGLEALQASTSFNYGVSGSFGNEPSGDSRSGSLSLSRSLFRTPRIIATRDAAKADLAKAMADEPVTVRELELAAQLAVYDVLRQTQLLRAASEQTKMRSAHLDLTRMMRQAETVADFEVVQAATELSLALGDEAAARLSLDQLLARLKRLLTLPQGTPLAVEAGAPPAMPGAGAQERLEMACTLRPEVAQAQAAIRQSDANVKLAATTSDLTTGLSGSLSQSPLLDGSAKIRWKLTASGSKVLMDADAQVSAQEQAAARLQASELELDVLRHDIALELTQAELTLRNAWERLSVAEAGIREARETLAIAQLRFEVHYGLGIEVLDAQTALTALEVEAVNAQFDVYSAITQLRSAVGLTDDAR